LPQVLQKSLPSAMLQMHHLGLDIGPSSENYSEVRFSRFGRGGRQRSITTFRLFRLLHPASRQRSGGRFDCSSAPEAARMKRLLVLILLLVPASLNAQARKSISAYMAADPLVPGDPLLVGFTYAKEGGPFVLRFGAGFDISAPPEPAGDSGAPPPASGIWS